jgi:hypothetical protein
LLAIALVTAGCTGSAAQGNDSSATTAPAPTTSTTVAPTTTTVVKVPLTRTISDGMNGDDVARIQQRLKDMNFDPGPVDGDYGMATTQAVWAFEKLVLHRAVPDVTNKVSPELWDTMQDPISIQPRRPQAVGSHFEVYLPEQVAIVFENNAPRLITHVSTGSNKEWCEVGFCSTAITPSGVYQLGRRVDGWDTGILGQMYNPIYFNYGVAVHGAYNVPLYPASHGCVRLPMHIAKYFPSLVKRGDQVFVFDGLKDPEAYGSPPPPFNQRDPNATTTTVAPPTTVAKPTTTTVAGAKTTTTSAAPKPAATTTTTAAAPVTTTTAEPAPATTAAAPPAPAPTEAPATTAAPTG